MPEARGEAWNVFRDWRRSCRDQTGQLSTVARRRVGFTRWKSHETKAARGDAWELLWRHDFQGWVTFFEAILTLVSPEMTANDGRNPLWCQLEDWGELREKLTLSLLAFIDFKMIHIYKSQEREKNYWQWLTIHYCLLNKAYQLSYQT